MSKRKLLLADDSVTIQKVVNLTFADEGIEVISVGDGDSAMQRIAESVPDVVLADVHMPGLNGYQICERLRHEPSTRDLPVVLLVGSFEPFDEEEAARVGANAYLTKPFQSIRQLVSQVSDLMDSRATAAAAAPEETVTEFVAEQDTPTPRAPDAPDTSDIDHLIQRSFGASEGESEPGESGPPRYVDAGMDDEMIETSHVADEGTVGATPDSVESGYTFAEDADADADAMTERIESPYAVEEEHADATTEETFNIPPVEETGEGYYSDPAHQTDAWPAESTAESFAQAAVSSAPSPFDTPASETAATPPQPVEDQGYVDQFARTEQIAPEHLADTRGELDLDEIELLELPPMDDGRTLEFTTTQSMAAQGGRKQVVSLSPELMDIIVQKVVEKLSEKY